MRLKRRIPWISLFLAILLAGCNIADPSIIDRPTVVKEYQPRDIELTAFLGDTLNFSIVATDPDGQKIQQYFLLGDSLVSGDSEWEYIVEDTGRVTVTGVVTDGQFPREVSWAVDRYKPVNLNPVIKSFEPPEPEPIVIIGNQLEFSIQAEDPEGKQLIYYYELNGEVVTLSRRYSFVAEELGDYRVTAVAYDGEKYAAHEWMVHVSAVPDLIPPAPVEIISLETGVNPGELVVQWIAVGADSMEGIPSYYRLRTSTSEILTEQDWVQASDRPGEPAPANPGELQTMIVSSLPPANLVYLSVRAVDEFGNMSNLGPSLGEWSKGNEISGLIINTVTGDPAEGVRVWFQGLMNIEAITGVDGRFEFMELPEYNNGLIIVDDDVDPQVFGTYFRFNRSYSVTHNDVLNFGLLPVIQLETTIYPDFLNFFKNMNDGYTHPFGNYLRTWDIPVDIYVPDFEKDGLDYRATVIGVLDEYEAIIGLDVFNVVDSPPDLGISVEYSNPPRDEYSVLEWAGTFYVPLKGRIAFRSSYALSTVGAFQKVIRHEVGHSLAMKHSLDRDHIMYGSIATIPSVTNLSPDEVALIRTMYRLPRGMSLNILVAD